MYQEYLWSLNNKIVSQKSKHLGVNATKPMCHILCSLSSVLHRSFYIYKVYSIYNLFLYKCLNTFFNITKVYLIKTREWLKPRPRKRCRLPKKSIIIIFTKILTNPLLLLRYICL